MLQKDSVQAFVFSSVLLEEYRYAPGCPPDVPPHTHEEYQIGLNLTHNGAYRYRGAKHGIPVGSLSIIPPGEVHATCSSCWRDDASRYRMVFLPGEQIQRVMGESTDGNPGRLRLPFFSDPILWNPELALQWTVLYDQLQPEQGHSLLYRETLLCKAIAGLVTPFVDAEKAIRMSRSALLLARDYLQAHFDTNVPLTELSQMVGISPFHLVRSFRKAFGVPPHEYQTQLRVVQAKRLLLTERSIAQIAQEVGFYDQSHLRRHFKRLVGVSPRNYRNVK